MPLTGLKPYQPPLSSIRCRCPTGSYRLGIILILLLLFVAPAAAQSHLLLGVPNTSPVVYAALPNQHGMDDMTSLWNLSFTSANVSIGNVLYPPIFESNSTVIPWEIWIIFVIIGVIGVFGAFVYPLPEGQMISAIVGAAFSGYSYVLSAMIGFIHITNNPQGMALSTGGSEVWGIMMVNVVQPVYTVYSPPYLWVIMLILVFASIFGIINAMYNITMKGIGDARKNRNAGYKGVYR